MVCRLSSMSMITSTVYNQNWYWMNKEHCCVKGSLWYTYVHLEEMWYIKIQNHSYELQWITLVKTGYSMVLRFEDSNPSSAEVKSTWGIPTTLPPSPVCVQHGMAFSEAPLKLLYFFTLLYWEMKWIFVYGAWPYLLLCSLFLSMEFFRTSNTNRLKGIN